MAPAEPGAHVTRGYRGDTLVLETLFSTNTGEVALIDFMVPGGEWSSIVRLVQGRRGRVAMHMRMLLRFDYGATVPWVTQLDNGDGLRAIAGPDLTILRTQAPLKGRDFATYSDFSVGAGETIAFVLTHGPSHLPLPRPFDPIAALAQTEAFWIAWSGRCAYGGRYRNAVIRSLIVLKALTYVPTGGIVAAPTTSLPEQLGGVRNWDYRYCWLRDASLTLQALMGGGYFEEARAWGDWLHRSIAGSPAQVQIMYGLAGERRLSEWEAGWLPGYQGARPVRIGNAASEQLQLDNYGEVLDASARAALGGVHEAPESWDMLRLLVEHLETIWHLPDKGIWELRAEARQLTHSKIMCWVALDRAITIAEQFSLPAPMQRWQALRDKIHATVCREGFDAAQNSFTQSFGSPELDASLLLIPQLGFLPADDPRVPGTVAAIERHLLVDGFVKRYDTAAAADGLPAGEGAFLACSFWLVDAYSLTGRLADARALFERLISHCNDLGLLAEEYDPAAGRLVGNFPQAFSHTALLRSAFMLSAATRPPGEAGSRSGEL